MKTCNLKNQHSFLIKLLKKIMKIISILILSILGMIGCKKNAVESAEQIDIIDGLVGKWQGKNIFLSDATTNICYDTQNNRPFIVTFKTEVQDGKKTITLSGAAPVNTFFGSLKSYNFNKENDFFDIEMGVLGSTKMAGPPELMSCETTLFNFLNGSKNIKMSADGKTMTMGNHRTKETNPRDGGTYIIFEKIEE